MNQLRVYYFYDYYYYDYYYYYRLYYNDNNIFYNLVHFDELDIDTIEAYVSTGDPMDKAGSYGIQSIASSFVHKLNGCYFNVVGFPIHRFTKELLLMLK